MKSLSSILLAGIIVGCMQKIPEASIENPIPKSFKAPLPESTLPSSMKQVSLYQTFNQTGYQWWELFQNEELNQLIQEAFGENFTMKAYYARFEEAMAQAGISLADLYPHLTLEADAERNRIAKSKRLKMNSMTGGSIAMPPPPPPDMVAPPPTFSPTFQKQLGPKYNSDLLLNLGFSYEVDLWGKFKMAYDASKERVTESQETYRSAQLNLAANLANNYFRSRYYTDEINLIENQIRALKELIFIEQDKFSSGFSRKDPLLTAQSIEEIAQSNKETTLLQRSYLDDVLAVLSGVPPELFTTPSQTYPLHLPDMPTTINSTLLLQRPDIRALQAEVRARALEVGVAQADILPSLTLGAGAGFESNKTNTLLKWKNHIWSLASSLSYDLYDAGRKSSILDQNKALFKESLAQYQERVLEAIQEIDDALYALHEAKTNLQTEKARNLQLKERTSLAQSRYEAGLAAKSEYLQGLVDLLDEEITLSQRRLSYLQASISLLTAIGGKW